MSSKNVLRLLQAAREIKAKTADYTVVAGDFDSIFTTRGAGAKVTFTLPSAANSKGGIVEFYNIANYHMAVAGASGELVVFNNAAATSITFDQAGELIGAGFRAICDGTSWIVVPLKREAVSVTVA
jgi:hypothetical protein